MTVEQCKHTETLDAKAGNFALYRRNLADRWRDKVLNVVHKDLKKRLKEAANELDRGFEAIRAELIPKWKRRSRLQRVPLFMQIAAEGYQNIEGKAVDIEQSTNPVPENPLDDALMAQRVRPPVEDYVKKTVDMETDTSYNQIQGIVGESREQGDTIDEIARNLSREAGSMTRAKANMVSRTSTIWANNEGSVLGYQDQGVPYMIWRVTADDRTCPICLAQDGKKIKTGGNFYDAGDTIVGTDGTEYDTAFDVGHPPVHLNGRCVILPAYE